MRSTTRQFFFSVVHRSAPPPCRGRGKLLCWLLLCPLLFCLVFFAGGQVHAAQDVHIRVLPQAEVYGVQFTLGEIAEIDGFDLKALKRLSEVRIGPSPLPGRHLRIHASLIHSRLAPLTKGLKLKLQVPPHAMVLRPGQRIRAEEITRRVLKRASEDAALATGDELSQEIVRPPADVLLPKGKLDWEVQPMGRHLVRGGLRMYQVRLRVEGEQAWKGILQLRQKIYRQVVVATRPIRRHQKIAATDVVLVRKNISANRADPYLGALNQVVGQLATRPVGIHQSLHATMLKKPSDVPEGGKVTVVYQNGGLLLQVPGVAMVPGRSGQFIPVRNLASGKIVHGVLQSDDTVRVN